MPLILTNIINILLISFGIIIGASTFAGIGAMISNHPPLKTMLDLAGSLKIWAIAIAIGGTFSSLEILDQGILKGEIRSIAKQVIYILTAIIGANLGYSFIKLIQRCGEIWMK